MLSYQIARKSVIGELESKVSVRGHKRLNNLVSPKRNELVSFYGNRSNRILILLVNLSR